MLCIFSLFSFYPHFAQKRVIKRWLAFLGLTGGVPSMLRSTAAVFWARNPSRRFWRSRVVPRSRGRNMYSSWRSVSSPTGTRWRSRDRKQFSTWSTSKFKRGASTSTMKAISRAVSEAMRPGIGGAGSSEPGRGVIFSFKISEISTIFFSKFCKFLIWIPNIFKK